MNRKRVVEQAAHYLLLISALAPVGLVLWYVVSFANPVPVGDQWYDEVYIAVKTRLGILGPQDLLAYDVGHRLVIGRLLAVLSTILTDYDVRILRFAPFVFALFNFSLVALLFSKTHRGLVLAVAIFSMAVLLFTIYYSRNWLDAHYSTYHLSLSFVLIGLVILQRMKPGWFSFALLILCAVASSFTVASGAVAWIALPIAAIGVRAYHRLHYVILWCTALALFVAFYLSGYAPGPESRRSWPDNIAQTLLYIFKFQATRFNTNTVNAVGFTLICSLALVINIWRMTFSEGRAKIVPLWGSLAVFALGGAAMVAIGRPEKIPAPARYSQMADGFWLAFIALALAVLARRPPRSLLLLNVALLILLVGYSVNKNIWSIQKLEDPYPPACDNCVLDYPLTRAGCLRRCFTWSEDQSVYHLAALRLSVFRDETPSLILPRIAPVIMDMPNRWLSVYVRDYMLAGVPLGDILSIAPVKGEWLQPREPISPHYRGEWPTDILPRPLTQTWTSPASLAVALPALIEGQPLVWYLNVPETEAHFAEIAETLAKLGYTRQAVLITNPRYVSAHFHLWCFKQKGSDACVTSAPGVQRMSR